MQRSDVVVELSNVTKRFGNTTAVDGLNLRLHAGETIALLGANGAGKSTSVEMMLGLLAADSGKVTLLGLNPREARARTKIGVMLQQTGLPEVLTVRELISLWAAGFAAPLSVDIAAEQAGVAEFLARRYNALSGGEQRRVQFALSLVGNPRVLFLDEPTVGMDVHARRRFWERLRALKSQGVALLLTTHHLEEAESLADRVVVLKAGKVVADGAPAALSARNSARLIRIRTHLSPALLNGWSQVQAVRELGARIEISATDSDHVLRRILREDADASDIEISGSGLEQAFVELTGEAA
jgi:ABC-2 type transport system ATP-binding protein